MTESRDFFGYEILTPYLCVDKHYKNLRAKGIDHMNALGRTTMAERKDLDEQYASKLRGLLDMGWR